MFDVNTTQEMKKLLIRVNKEKKFCLKVQKMVKDIESSEKVSLADCWRWLKGLVHDFIQQKNKNN